MGRKIWLLPLLLFLFFCGCSAQQDIAYSQALAVERASSRETVSGENPAAQAELRASLTLRTYTAMSSVDVWKSYIEEFQETYPNVSIEVIDSEAFSDPEAYVARTTVALLSGEAGDILDLNYLPSFKYSASGVLASLDEWMENAPGFSLEDYYTNVFDAYRYQGKLYSLPYEFDLAGVWLNKSLADQLGVEAGDGIRIMDLLRLYGEAKALPDASEPFYLSSFANWNSLNSFAFSSFIDEQEKNANFTSEAFQNYLNQLKTIDYSEKAGNGGGPGTMPMLGLEPLESNELGILLMFPMGNQKSMQFFSSEETSAQQFAPFMPIESEQGDGYFYSSNLAITSACREKEAAFAFLRFMLDNERKLSEENYMRSDLGHVNRRLNREFMEQAFGAENRELVDRVDTWCEQAGAVTMFYRNPELYDRLC